MIEATERGVSETRASRAGVLCHDGDTVSLAGLHVPCIEVRVAFVLPQALPVHGGEERDVIAAAERVVPAITLFDNRIRYFPTERQCNGIDGTSPARVVLGWGARILDSVDLADLHAELYSGYRWREVLVARGRAFGVMGSPVSGSALPARRHAASGVRFEAGDTVLSGSCTDAIEVAGGDHYRAEIAGLGSVSVDFC